MMRLRARQTRRARVEMVPLIDTVFLLLVFFIYAMLTMSVHRGVKVDLPRAGNPRPQIKEHVVVTITSDGSLLVNKQPVSEDTLLQHVRDALASSPRRIVVIDGDRNAALGKGVSVLEKLSRLRDVKVAFSVEREESE